MEPSRANNGDAEHTERRRFWVVMPARSAAGNYLGLRSIRGSLSRRAPIPQSALTFRMNPAIAKSGQPRAIGGGL